MPRLPPVTSTVPLRAAGGRVVIRHRRAPRCVVVGTAALLGLAVEDRPASAPGPGRTGRPEPAWPARSCGGNRWFMYSSSPGRPVRCTLNQIDSATAAAKPATVTPRIRPRRRRLDREQVEVDRRGDRRVDGDEAEVGDPRPRQREGEQRRQRATAVSVARLAMHEHAHVPGEVALPAEGLRQQRPEAAPHRAARQMVVSSTRAGGARRGCRGRCRARC